MPRTETLPQPPRPLRFRGFSGSRCTERGSILADREKRRSAAAGPPTLPRARSSKPQGLDEADAPRSCREASRKHLKSWNKMGSWQVATFSVSSLRRPETCRGPVEDAGRPPIADACVSPTRILEEPLSRAPARRRDGALIFPQPLLRPGRWEIPPARSTLGSRQQWQPVQFRWQRASHWPRRSRSSPRPGQPTLRSNPVRPVQVRPG
jgi:hypothetical protein